MAMSKSSFSLFSLVFVILLSIGLHRVDAFGPPCKTNQDCVLYCSVPIQRGTGICLGGYCTCEKQESINNARKILHD
uniref:Knottin scorpion toxin-like domain-containing protein n=1 Tax=Solanum lycopersicum TaxID=4081 RepID=A0A3Q7F6M2_SOLLC